MRPSAECHWGTCSEYPPSLPPGVSEDIPQDCPRMGARTPHLVLARRHSTTTNHSAQPHRPCGSLPIWLSSQPYSDILCWVPPWAHHPFGEGRAIGWGSWLRPRGLCRLSCPKLTLSRTSLQFETECSKWEWLCDFLQICTPDPNSRHQWPLQFGGPLLSLGYAGG